MDFMTMSKMNSKVDGYLRGKKEWLAELQKLRAILVDCGLTEEFKWWQPCYTFDGKNVIILHGMKETCALAFFKGTLLKDPRGLLVAPGPNSQSGRWIKFTSLQEIEKLEPVLREYIQEAIEAEKAGLQVKFKTVSEFKVPAELKAALKKNRALKKAFDALTPGRQRGYLLYFSGAKQSKTREARIKKWAPRILKGKGMQD
jgi:uncharacterized protein YdeI (YjbR/CyaY-like superfamily)